MEANAEVCFVQEHMNERTNERMISEKLLNRWMNRSRKSQYLHYMFMVDMHIWLYVYLMYVSSHLQYHDSWQSNPDMRNKLFSKVGLLNSRCFVFSLSMCAPVGELSGKSFKTRDSAGAPVKSQGMKHENQLAQDTSVKWSIVEWNQYRSSSQVSTFVKFFVNECGIRFVKSWIIRHCWWDGGIIVYWDVSFDRKRSEGWFWV